MQLTILILHIKTINRMDANRTWDYTEGCAVLDIKILFSPTFHNKMKHKNIFHHGSP